MSKKASAGRSGDTPIMRAGATPPPLSEKLIAQLQGAVDAAQRKRLVRFEPVMEPRDEALLTK